MRYTCRCCYCGHDLYLLEFMHFLYFLSPRSDTIWVCPLSDKKFRDPIYVRKHILNKHADKLEATKKENVRRSLCFTIIIVVNRLTASYCLLDRRLRFALDSFAFEARHVYSIPQVELIAD